MKKLQIYTILNKLNDRTNFLNFSLNNFKFLKILFHKNVYVAYKIWTADTQFWKLQLYPLDHQVIWYS